MIHEMQAMCIHMDSMDIHVLVYHVTQNLEIETESSIFIKNNFVYYFLKLTSSVFLEWKLSSK